MRLPLVGLILLVACDEVTPLGADDVATDAAATDSAVDPELDAAAPDVPVGGPPDAAPDVVVDAARRDRCPADDPADAPWLEPGVEHTDKLCRGRSAWYRLEVPAHHAASAVLAFSHARGDLELRLVDADGEVLATSETATDIEQVSGPVAATPTHVALEVYGHQGAGGIFRLTPRLFDAADGEATRVSGTVRFEDRPFGPEGFTGERVPSPARGVVVEAVREVDGVVVAEAVTGADGAFELSLVAQPVAHSVRATSELRVRGFEARVRAVDDGLRYAVSAPLVAGAPLDLLASADDGVGGALNILDSAYAAFDTIADVVGAPSPPLTYRWTPGRAFACGSCYGDDTISLGGQLDDPDEFDDVVIIHELGHYFVEHFSRDDSPGGTHRDNLVSPHLAYGEGLAYFFAALVRDDADLVDNFFDHVRWIDIEAMTVSGAPDDALRGTGDGTPGGPHREELVAGLMWDAYDASGAEEPHDTLAIGVGGSLHLLVDVLADRRQDVGPRGMEVTDWLDALACLAGVEPVQPLVDEREFPWDVGANLACEKGRTPAPYALVRRQGGVWLVGEAGAPVVVSERLAGPRWRRRTLECEAPCRVASAREDAAVVVTTPGAEWSGASWLGKGAAAALLGGRVVAGARIYSSR